MPSLITDKNAYSGLFPTLKLTDASKLLPTLANIRQRLLVELLAKLQRLARRPVVQSLVPALAGVSGVHGDWDVFADALRDTIPLGLVQVLFLFFDLLLRLVDRFQKGNVLECA